VISRREVETLVKGMAPEFELNPELVLAIIEVESNFNAKAQSPKRAQGLMQLIPATARRFGVTDPWDPRQNLHGGMSYLRWLLQRFNGDVRLALAGYNAGEGAVERHGGVPPYSETRGYLRRIAGVLGVAEEELSQYRGRPNAFVTQPRGPDSESGWESRFFDVDFSG
jgi:soluble lytic murein transglycosylase-like protein